MIKVGIIGAAGYVAGELIRLLVNHPEVEIDYLCSRSQTGKNIATVHEDLIGETDLMFSKDYHLNVAVVFLCMGHGESAPFIAEIPKNHPVVIIDLSADFRLNRTEHNFVYGLPEINLDAIVTANRIANPGCFATCIQLGLLPVLANEIKGSKVFISGITGATGAGVKPSGSSHFAWRMNNISVYKAFDHQHLKEINETFKLFSETNEAPDLVFVPHRGDFARGIFCSHHFKSDKSLEELQEIYESFYANAPFTIFTKTNPNLKQVVNTNKCLVYLEKKGGNVLMVTVIDNLLKGASGQAVENMNIRFGFKQTTGLNLKATAF